MPRRMPTPLYVLVEAVAYAPLFLAIGLALPSQTVTLRDAVGYAAVLVPVTALALLTEEAATARVEGRRMRSPRAVLGGTVELKPRRPLAAILAGALIRELVLLLLAGLGGLFRPPLDAHVTPAVLASLYAFAIVEELSERISPLRPALKARRERLRNPTPP